MIQDPIKRREEIDKFLRENKKPGEQWCNYIRSFVTKDLCRLRRKKGKKINAHYTFEFCANCRNGKLINKRKVKVKGGPIDCPKSPNAPYGMKGKVKVPGYEWNSIELFALSIMLIMRQNDKILQAIADQLNRIGIKNRAGTNYSPASIRVILKGFEKHQQYYKSLGCIFVKYKQNN